MKSGIEKESSAVYLEKPLVERGRLIAEILMGVWRESPPSLALTTDELTQVAPLLLGSGAGGLGWWRVRNSALREFPVGDELHQAYRLHTLEAAMKEQAIGRAFSFLRSHGLDPLLGKGWAIGRRYPARGLRPYGDLDLYAAPEQHSRFVAALREPGSQGWSIDLHQGAAELDDRSFESLYDRSQVVSLGDGEARIMGAEDNLRLLCLHTLRHGAWRPLWLCDIAVALESRPDSFDWDYFQSGDAKRSDWVACSIGLAHQILGARVDQTPVEKRAKHLPGWMVPTVLRQWGAGQTPHGCRAGMETYLRSPMRFLRALRIRWPNPIEATIGVRGPFNELPRLPFQIGDALLRTAKFLTAVPRSLR